MTTAALAPTVTYRTGDYYGDGSSNHIWEIHEDGTVVAELYVATANHEIMNIQVKKPYQGQGLARALYEAATDQMDVYHAPVAHRTPEGNAFAEAVGGPTIDPYPCTCYGCNAPCEDE